MSGSVKTGLSSQEKLTQKNPAKETDKAQRTKPNKEACSSYGKPGKFTIK